MDSTNTLGSYTGLAVLFATIVVTTCLLKGSRPSGEAVKASGRPESVEVTAKVPDHVRELVEVLKSTLPKDVVSLGVDASEPAVKGHWAEQECERIPACVVRPSNSGHVSTAVTALLRTHVSRLEGAQARSGAASGSRSAVEEPILFAVRGGGHSAVPGAASVSSGVLIDLGRMNEVYISNDRKSVSVGAGARWSDVSSLLDKEGLVAVGGRNSHVGVGGLTLGGGLSFFSPLFGLVCSNVLEYEVVSGAGQVLKASATSNPELWRALKGGANNFGIVTRFTLRCFPGGDIWSGFLYIPAFEANKVLATFNKSVARANPDLPTRDKYAAGPIACFTYIQGVPFQVISVNLVYTKAPQDGGGSKWPEYWKQSGFDSIWRFWSTLKTRTLTDATDEMNSLNPPGRRQVLSATTVKNDLATLQAAHMAYKTAIASVSRIKGISWTLVMQPLVPEWARKGDPNPLGLDEGVSEPLAIISFTVNWADAKDDELARAETRRVVEEIEAFAAARGTAHRYRYLNYCDSWQDPFDGYGSTNREFLVRTSKNYDPDGLFQIACSGGFKLWA